MSELKLQNGENIEIFDSLFLAALNSSHDFLSVIFGILGKFRIDIGEKIFFQKKNSRWKKSWQKLRKNILGIFDEKCRFQLKNLKILTKIFRKSGKFWKIFSFFRKSYFSPRKINIFRWDFFKSSSPDQGESG